MQDINKKNNRPIGVFDSGVGGLSVLRELQYLLPNENFIFLADQLHVPYGEKSKKKLVNLVYKITDYFIKNHKIKMMVVACNTATCNTIDELRKKYSFPIVGTVPAVRLAAKKTKSGTVAIISTPSTSKSEVLQNLIEDYCRNIKVLNISGKNLENVVETGELSAHLANNLLQRYLTQVKDSGADHLVLGCTHYVFLKKAIRKFIGSRIKIIDSGKAIANQTRTLLKKQRIQNDLKKRGETIYFSSGNPVKFSKVASKLLKKKVFAFNAVL